ncbi:TMV resistance protein N-like [Dorcoceras hygrometricum]|uniref:TMV resistance protein N-like n=1 Tax=Dorcoceras hygrometricum TaxID=472368 RepID=A0A2Z7CI14_9LAMI|nr:TMV resistance protein N-like [Dorcoceras hygrometricum]
MLCMRSRLQTNTGSQRIPKATQQLESEQKTVATMCVSIWELPTRLSTRYQVHKQRSTRCCPTHEMWELPTPLTVANSPSKEMRKIPLEEFDPQNQSPSLAPGELLDSTPALGCVNHLFYAYCNICFVFAQPLFIYIFAQHLVDLRFATTDQQFASAVVSSSANSFQQLIVFFVITLRSTAVHSAVGFLRIAHQLLISSAVLVCIQLFELLVMYMLQLIVLCAPTDPSSRTSWFSYSS